MPPPPRGRRILSGTTPTAPLHIGNYFGAIRQYLALQEHNQAAYFIADLHSMNVIRDGERRRALAFEVAVEYLALGLDPARAILYRQSDIPEVTELAWILSTLTPMGLLERGHAYKDRVAQGQPADHGLFAYPVLMAADILIHRAELVPVGADQKQHIEMARDMAGKFNATYGDCLTLPEPYIVPEVAVVPGLDGRKMSKSYENTIPIFAAEKDLRKLVLSIVTDSTPVDAPKDPDTSNLFALWRLFAEPAEIEAMALRFRRGPLGYGEVKKDLLARLLDAFGPARARRDELLARPDRVEDVLREGARRARETTDPLMEEVRSRCGLGARHAGRS